MEENFETRLVHSKKLESESFRDRFVVTVGFLSSVASSRASLKSESLVSGQEERFFNHIGPSHQQRLREFVRCIPGCDVCSVHL
ncbi:hypothetical protein TNCT_466191 [Trichonephila clavata]|uniref:Uncharacterized protein n=1 Tax=Trichonephila clavata TaxID=2740835 RepID=A0A8X6HZJ9_TRICU|nr:hypothetical protein TNCT_466191 [Trichonephila clavata]